jgi:toxin ParE1/3/4
MADYRLSPAAERDLETIFDRTVAEWGLSQALRYTDLLEAGCAALADAPQRSQRCDPIRPGYRRRRVEHHFIYFQRTDYGIAVMRILHERMDAPRHL